MVQGRREATRRVYLCRGDACLREFSVERRSGGACRGVRYVRGSGVPAKAECLCRGSPRRKRGRELRRLCRVSPDGERRRRSACRGSRRDFGDTFGRGRGSMGWLWCDSFWRRAGQTGRRLFFLDAVGTGGSEIGCRSARRGRRRRPSARGWHTEVLLLVERGNAICQRAEPGLFNLGHFRDIRCYAPRRMSAAKTVGV